METQTVYLIVIQVICLIITMVAIRGEQDESSAIALLLAFLPGIGYLIAIVSIVQIVARGFISGGKCVFGHSYIDVTYTPRRMLRLPIGGYDNYECRKCKNKTSVKWCAF